MDLLCYHSDTGDGDEGDDDTRAGSTDYANDGDGADDGYCSIYGGGGGGDSDGQHYTVCGKTDDIVGGGGDGGCCKNDFGQVYGSCEVSYDEKDDHDDDVSFLRCCSQNLVMFVTSAAR